MDSVPTKPRNPWQIFLRENIKGYKERGEKVDLKSVAKIFGDKWRALPDSEKEVTYKKKRKRKKEDPSLLIIKKSRNTPLLIKRKLHFIKPNWKKY